MGTVALAVSPLIITELCKPAPVYQGLLNYISTQRGSATYRYTDMTVTHLMEVLDKIKQSADNEIFVWNG